MTQAHSHPADAKTDETAALGRAEVKSGLFCLALLSRLKGKRFNNTVLSKRYGQVAVLSQPELIHSFQDLGFNAHSVKIKPRKLSSLPLPAIFHHKQYHYVVVLGVDDEKIMFHSIEAQNARSQPIDDFLSDCAGEAIVVEVRESEQGQKRFGLAWFFSTLTKYRIIVREILLASFFIQVFALVTPLFFMVIIDKVFSHNNLSTLDVLVFAMIVVTLFEVLLNGLRTYLSNHTTSRVDLELGTRFFRHLISLPLAYFEARRTGDTIARMKELDTIRQFLTGSTVTIFIDVLFVFVFLFVMYLFSPLLASIVVISLPLFLLVSVVVTPLMKSKLEDKHEKMAENQSFLVETLGGIEMIKSAASEPQQQREWDMRLAALSKCSFHSGNLANVTNQVTSLLSKALTVILLYTGAKLVLGGELSVGQLIAFNMLTGRVVQPIQRIAGIWQEFTGMKVSVARLADIMDAPTEPLLLTERTGLPAVRGDIVFNNVSFQYAEDKPAVLQNVSFKIAVGEVIGVVGSTGSGKTTVAKLLQRLYVPSAGTISIDGMDIHALDGAWLREQIGVVAQDFVLFNQSIRDNILAGKIDIEDEQVISVAKLVGAHEMIASLPQGYDTILNERGRGLSTGQRQAVALARALINDPPILLLDEATSAMDYESEHRFQSKFTSIVKGRTTIVIAHRLSTVRYVDRILTFEGGCLVEDGTPEVLLEKGGRFAKLSEIHHRGWQPAQEAS